MLTTVHVRDDFDGTAGARVDSRPPNVAEYGAAWSSAPDFRILSDGTAWALGGVNPQLTFPTLPSGSVLYMQHELRFSPNDADTSSSAVFAKVFVDLFGGAGTMSLALHERPGSPLNVRLYWDTDLVGGLAYADVAGDPAETFVLRIAYQPGSISYYFNDTLMSTVTVPVIAVPTSRFFLHEESTADYYDIQMQLGDPVGSTYIRDDFDGTSGVDFQGRVPNISTTGEAWYDLTLGEESGWYEFQTQGDGSMAAIYQPGADSGAAYGKLGAGSLGGTVTVRFNVRNMDGTSDAISRATVGYAYVNIGDSSSGGDPVIEVQFRNDDLICYYPNASEFPESGGNLPSPAGLAGALAEGQVVWGDGYLTVTYNGLVLLDHPVRDDETSLPQSPVGDVWVEFALAGGNAMEFIEIKAETSVVPDFWMDFRASREAR